MQIPGFSMQKCLCWKTWLTPVIPSTHSVLRHMASHAHDLQYFRFWKIALGDRSKTAVVGIVREELYLGGDTYPNPSWLIDRYSIASQLALVVQEVHMQVLFGPLICIRFCMQRTSCSLSAWYDPSDFFFGHRDFSVEPLSPGWPIGMLWRSEWPVPSTSKTWKLLNSSWAWQLIGKGWKESWKSGFFTVAKCCKFKRV